MDVLDTRVVPPMNDEVAGDGTEVIDVATPTVNSPGTGKRHVDMAEMEQMLQNYRMRKRLGLLPHISKAPQEEEKLRWIRHSHRPMGLAAIEEAGNHPARSSAAELASQIADVQQNVDQHYRELNATRRSGAAISLGLRRQEESVAALSTENSSLQARLDALNFEIKERLARNRQLSVQLGLQRQSEADGSSQPAVLAKTVRLAETAALRRPLCPAMPPPRIVTTEGNGALPSTAALENSVKRLGELAAQGRVEASLQAALQEACRGLAATCPIEDRTVKIPGESKRKLEDIQSYRDLIKVLDAENITLRAIIEEKEKQLTVVS